MPDSNLNAEQAIRETAYFFWEHEGRPDGRAWDHWLRAVERMGDRRDAELEPMEDEEKVLAGRQDVNMPALLTRDVQGG
jgi:hypothetical protein